MIVDSFIVKYFLADFTTIYSLFYIIPSFRYLLNIVANFISKRK